MVGIPKSEAQELVRAFGQIAIVTKDRKIWVLGMSLSYVFEMTTRLDTHPGIIVCPFL